VFASSYWIGLDIEAATFLFDARSAPAAASGGHHRASVQRQMMCLTAAIEMRLRKF